MARDLLSDLSSSDSEDGGAALPPSADLKVNEAYARRFEYNKKREEKARLEEKLGKDSASQTRKRKRADSKADDLSDDDSDESTSESEDEGELATEAVDAELMATIAAIRNRDPKIYDPNTKFFHSLPDDDDDNSNDNGNGNGNDAPKEKKEKPLHLRDYHRQNLLNGSAAADADDGDDEGVADSKKEQPLAYNEEQALLKKEIVTSMHAALEDDGDEDDGFLTAKEKPKAATASQKPAPVLDVENADKDPEGFLSNFVASRAWASHDDRNLVPFESDDDEDDKRADEYEEAYNMRFEDPAKANEKLRSHARDMAAKYSVRRDEANPRQRKREAEKAKKEAARQERKEEKARLRKLRIEEVEAKVRRIKHAAGLKTEQLQPEDWQRFVDEDWDDKQWEEEMARRFGDDYYAAEDVDSDASNDDSGPADPKRKKPKKPKFDDDIDIKDLIPDYEDGPPAALDLSEAGDDDDDDDDNNNDNNPQDEPRPADSNKDKKKQKQKDSSDAKRERRIIEALVDEQLKLDTGAGTGGTSGFRYRATSPQSFGLTAQDILLAEDAQLNQFAGLKKLATFRDPEKKKRDKKHLGKKARLRKWREEVFGGANTNDGRGPAALEEKSKDKSKNKHDANADANDDADAGTGSNVIDGQRKKKRRRKNKTENVPAELDACN